MTNLTEIRKLQKQGYYWAIENGKATLWHTNDPGNAGQCVISRNISPKFIKIALLTSIDVFCFSIFGRHGKDRIPSMMLESI